MLREDQRPGRTPTDLQPDARAVRGAPAAHDAAGVPGKALRPASDVNPYTRWIHDHPAVLLAEPTPAALHERLQARDGPLVVDLGCGSGNFLLELAAREPHARCVGFELRYKRLVKAARKVERAGLDNVWLLREVAERFGAYFAAGSVSAVYVNFPDPWPRRSEWKKRMVNPPLLRALERVLEPGGRFFLKTDHSGYFLHVLSLLREAPGLRLATLCNGLRPRPEAPGAPRTEFELLFRSQRKPVYRLVLERPPAGAAPGGPRCGPYAADGRADGAHG